MGGRYSVGRGGIVTPVARFAGGSLSRSLAERPENRSTLALKASGRSPIVPRKVDAAHPAGAVMKRWRGTGRRTQINYS